MPIKDKNNENAYELIGATTQNDVTQKEGPSIDPDANLNAGTKNKDLFLYQVEEGEQRQPANKSGTKNKDLFLYQVEEGGASESAAPETQEGSIADYSWNEKAEDRAKTQMSSDVLTAENEYLSSAQQLAQTAREYQTQADMAPYADAQNAEKVGWTGGYVLDQRRQTEYLKASIEAQLYGAMELQRYGYDSALAAARLSYDLNMKAYAEEYYNNAVNIALQEAQLTGTYVSAEYRDMISQYNTARSIIGTSTDENERTRAQNVLTSIKGWLSANGVSEASFNAIGKALSEIQKTLSEKEYEWEMYNAAVEAGKSQIENDPSVRFEFNDDGTVKIDETTGQPVTVNLDSMSIADLREYVGNKQGQDSFYSYIKSKLVGTIQSEFTNWAKGKGVLEYGTDGKYVRTIGNIEEAFKEYLDETKVLDKFSDVLDDATIKSLSKGWTYSVSLPDGTVIKSTYDGLKNYEPNKKESYVEQALAWGTYEDIDGGKSHQKTFEQLSNLKVGAQDNTAKIPLNQIVNEELDMMKRHVKTGTTADGTLFKLQRGGGYNESYLVLYYKGGYYLVSSNDKERAKGKGDEDEGETLERFLSYKGPKVSIRAGRTEYSQKAQES